MIMTIHEKKSSRGGRCFVIGTQTMITFVNPNLTKERVQER